MLDSPPVKPRSKRLKARQRQAAFALGAGLVFFALVELAIALLARTSRPDLRDPTFENKAALLRQRRRRDPDAPLVVMLGSSCTVNGFRGLEVEDVAAAAGKSRPIAMNFGNYGADPVAQRLYVGRLLAGDIKPDLVILEVLPHFFALRPGAFQRLPGYMLTRSEIRLLQRYGGPKDRMLEEHRTCRWNPLYGHRHSIVSQFFPFLVPARQRMECWRLMDESGWNPASDNRGARDAIGQSYVRDFGPKLKAFTPDGAAWGPLEESLNLLREQHIAVLLVVAPESPTMRAAYPAEQMERFYDKLRSLAERHGLPLVDAREWFDDERFADLVHLAPPAATTFSRRLGAAIVERGLLGR
jgi:hypothetical protein